MYVYIHIHMYIYIQICIHVYIYHRELLSPAGTRFLSHHSALAGPGPRVKVPDARITPRTPRRPVNPICLYLYLYVSI